MTILGIDPKLFEVFNEVVEKMAQGKLEPVYLLETAALTYYRLKHMIKGKSE